MVDSLFSMQLTDMVPAPGGDADELLRRTAAASSASEHAVAEAVVSGAIDRGVELPAIDGFQEIADRGVWAVVEGVEVRVGTRDLMTEGGLALVDEVERTGAALEDQGLITIFAGWDGQVRGVLAVADA